MKNYFIIHAMGNKANDYCYPWLKEQINKQGFNCYVPTMPNLKNSSYEQWEKEFKKISNNLNKDSVVIGHSTGSIFLAHYIISNKINVKKFIGVVSFNEPDGQGIHDDLDKINMSFFINNLQDLKIYAEERVCFYSPTDLYDYNKLDDFANKVEAKKVIIQNAGHFTATTGYGKRFEEILKYL